MSDLRRIIWLASYPKSGNTWMRSLLAHYFMPPGKAPDINNLRQFTTGDTRADFFDRAAGGKYEGRSLQDWSKTRQTVLRLIAGSKQNRHFVKTHCKPVFFLGTHLIPPDVTAGAVYIVRNPFDVVPSFARHVSATSDETIDRMCNPDAIMGTENGIYDALGRWDEHVTAWTTAPGLPRYVVRYEDMLDKPAKVVKGLLDFLGVKTDRPKLAHAIKATSFEAMKKQEEKLGFSERPTGMKSFFAKGRAGGWREDLTPAQVERIRDEFGATLETWYPELIKETDEFLRAS
ncbi:sulfotransferase domain-containing protein [Roseovarius rhodophyticola]|uniref:Sulfotransferase domain-containing protein n=1 Tax=Roseovarius rhodophyticola TaxID=3080827 RepID=A0ABZ2TG24_9RHOB|nr:sulfotransferase domain-containing protein [Roseovarius sp. W115]MDV2928838.1 sulfotransferase domain-containing protein [Roseovarius sp. W115]